MSLDTEFDKVRTEARSIGDAKGIDRSRVEEVIRNTDRAETRHSGEQGEVQANQLTDDVKYGVKTAMNALTLPFGFRGAMRRQEQFASQHDRSSEKNSVSQEKSDLRAQRKLEELKLDLASARNTQVLLKEETASPKPNKNSDA